jgi:putative membrane protein
MVADVASDNWLPGSWHPDVLLGVALLAAIYTLAWWRRHGRGIDAAAFTCFFAGLSIVVIALNGPLHDLSDRYLFSAHMVQHLLLTLAVPPLLLRGTPAFQVDALLRPLLRARPTRWAVLTLTRPVPALAAYGIALAIWHVPGPYHLALTDHRWHIVQHLSLMATATLAWWPVLSRSTVAPPLHYGAQILYLFVFGMPMTVVAAMITIAEDLLYPFYAAAPRALDVSPFADQRLGGIIMWVPAGLVPLVAFSVVFFRWAAAESDDAEPGHRVEA